MTTNGTRKRTIMMCILGGVLAFSVPRVGSATDYPSNIYLTGALTLYPEDSAKEIYLYSNDAVLIIYGGTVQRISAYSTWPSASVRVSVKEGYTVGNANVGIDDAGTYMVAQTAGVVTLSGAYADYNGEPVEEDLDLTFVLPLAFKVRLDVQATEPPTNAPPVAYDDTATTTISTPVTIDVLGNDIDPDADEDDVLTVISVTDPANGTAVTNGTTVTYTPGANFVGTDAFTYTISDGNGGTATATVTVTVNSGSIDIDIRPGSDSNRIYVWCPRFIPVVIPVAIRSTEGFDATALDPAKIFLGGAGVLHICGWGDRYLSTEFDVDDDGDLDLLLLVTMVPEERDPDPFPGGTAYLRVHAAAFPTSPVLYEGSDHIEIVKLY